MAHKKGQGVGKNGRDSNPQYRGIKKYGGQHVFPGTILIRQCGSHFRSGFNVGAGKDYTIYSLIEGVVKFESQRRISVYPVQK